MYKCNVCGVEDYSKMYLDDVLSVMESEGVCFNCFFWMSHLIMDDKKSVVFDIKTNRYYQLGKNNNKKAMFKGFNGNKFRIKYMDGREIITDDLWHNGEVPKVWMKKIPKEIYGEIVIL